MKEQVALRMKPLQGGVQSLYLDYICAGKRVKEYLKLYIQPETSKLNKLTNQETMKTALALKAQRTIDLQNGAAGFARPNTKITIIGYLDDCANRYRANGKIKSEEGIRGLQFNLRKCCTDIRLQDVDKTYLLSWVSAMRNNGLAPVTITNHFSFLNTQFKAAVRDGILATNPFDAIARHERPRMEQKMRQYLTMQEVGILAKAKVSKNMINDKRAFLFSCMTGLRYVDLITLTWGDIRGTDNGMEVVLRQHKTKEVVHVPVSDNAKMFLGETGAADALVFPGMHNSDGINAWLHRWTRKNGIDKYITFHCARHTFATLLLTNGVDIYTTSKLLGHASVTTTQIYAKVVDEKRVKAVNAIPSLKG